MTSCAPTHATKRSSDATSTRYHIPVGMYKSFHARLLTLIWEALQMAFFMFWEVLWPLVLGFLISAVVQSMVSRAAVGRVLGRDGLRGATIATLLGAASSSCSYAAVAVARGLFRKGATFTNAILFEFASTNLVFELGLVLLVLLGWQFLAAELAGGLAMIAILAVVFKYTLRSRLVRRRSGRQRWVCGDAWKDTAHG